MTSTQPASWRFVPAFLSFLVLLLAWKAISLLFLPIFLPGPEVLFHRFVLVFSDPASYEIVSSTLYRILVGLVASMAVGTVIGLFMGLHRHIEAFLDSWIMVLLTFPAICWAFLGVLWFGISDLGPILTVVLIVFPFVALNVWEGTKAVNKELMDMAQVYKANRSLTVRKVLLPQLMPHLFSSLRIALSLSWKIVLVGEAFGVGSGVGQKITFYFQDTRVDMMLAWGVSFMILMVLFDILVLRTCEKRVFAWRHQIAL